MKELNQYERLEQHWHILGLMHQMIRFSEIKAGMVITLFSVLMTVIFGSKDVLGPAVSESTLLLCFSVGFGILVCISFFFSVKAFFPKFFDKNPRSVIYYGDIKYEFNDYKAYSNQLSSHCDNGTEMEEQIAEQIHTLSGIADLKFKNVKSAVQFLVLALTMMLLTIIVFFTV